MQHEVRMKKPLTMKLLEAGINTLLLTSRDFDRDAKVSLELIEEEDRVVLRVGLKDE